MLSVSWENSFAREKFKLGLAEYPEHLVFAGQIASKQLAKKQKSMASKLNNALFCLHFWAPW